MARLEQEVETLHNVMNEIRHIIKNRTEQVRYNVNRRFEIEDKLETENMSLKEKLREVENHNDALRNQLDEIMGIEKFQHLIKGPTPVTFVLYATS